MNRKINKPDNAGKPLNTVIDKAGHYLVEQYDGFWCEYYLGGNKGAPIEEYEWCMQENTWEDNKREGIFTGFPWDKDEKTMKKILQDKLVKETTGYEAYVNDTFNELMMEIGGNPLVDAMFAMDLTVKQKSDALIEYDRH